MHKITPFLWYDNNAEEAFNFYSSVFPDAKILNASRNNGQVFVATVQIADQELIMMNGGPAFKLNEAFSLFVKCRDQEEVDKYWEELSADGGSKSKCGWLKDKFGVSWQVVPEKLMELMSGSDPKKSQAVMQAVMKMDKLVIRDLQEAWDNA